MSAPIFHMHVAESGERKPVPEAKRFSHYVQNVRFWFAVHPTPGQHGALTVSHWGSGKRVCVVPAISRIAGVGVKDQDIARAEIDKLCARVGEARVRSVLAAAEGAAA